MNINKWLNAINADFTGKTVVITGATGGLGKHIAKNFLTLNAHVVFAGSNLQKANTLKNQLLNEDSNYKIDIIRLDLKDTDEILKFSESLSLLCPNGIDILVNNAGVFKLPKQFTKQGFETHHAINYFGTVYLTLKLMPLLNMKENSKVIFQTSVSSLNFDIDWKDAERLNTKNKIKVYAQTKKLINLTSYYLNKKLKKHYANVSFVLVHPGVAGTNIVGHSNKPLSYMISKLSKYGMKIVFHSPEKASMPTMLGAVSDIPIDSWVGPRGIGQVWGKPKVHKLPKEYFSKYELVQLQSLLKHDLRKGGVYKEFDGIIKF